MQLGTRWTVGDIPPAGLPEVVVAAVRTVEDELRAEDVDARSWRWTLTWLERRPVIELDDGTVITYNAAEDTATIRQVDALEEDDEE
ncbi:hypothetical protein D9V29_07410 [Mycetocola manganoxydans]|uniref:Fe-S oxidoreductase n=1 Tax=Mycetocola manganoxydans TaxID=699879 RepID=A0A3L6ZUL2_9MICO|nr:hypothetical protein [Mycetocola manganoxydans]RLP71673.1 hypothetical protein D9V29_07410 [Mycetocola manganoxydans]GHD38981.1 hypothetical protein GCM10008097_01180 [Mycetocola manganoxydans]